MFPSLSFTEKTNRFAFLMIPLVRRFVNGKNSGFHAILMIFCLRAAALPPGRRSRKTGARAAEKQKRC